ncbi:MAG: hypothetical protein PVJ57_01460 [Phycisphaerae bacterium]
MTHPTLIAGAIVADGTNFSSIANVGLWLAVAAVLGLGGLLATRAAKRYARQEQRSEAFTLQDLREMRAEEKITEDEFRTLRAALLGQVESELAAPLDDGTADVESDDPAGREDH